MRVEHPMDLYMVTIADSSVATYRHVLGEFGRFACKFLRAEWADAHAAFELYFKQSKLNAQRIIESYKATELERGVSPRTLNSRCSIVQGFLRFCYRKGLIDYYPEFRYFKIRRKPITGPDPIDIERVIKIAKSQDNPVIAARDVAIIRLNFDLALRHGEILELDLSDIHLVSKEVRFIMVKTKGSTEKLRRDLSPITYKALAAWINERERIIRERWENKKNQRSGPLFISLRNKKRVERLTKSSWFEKLQKLGEEVGVVKMNTQKVRHTSITIAIEESQRQGLPLDSVLAHSRHTSLETLKHYRDHLDKYQPFLSHLVAQNVAG